jgi:hypothetical protein
MIYTLPRLKVTETSARIRAAGFISQKGALHWDLDFYFNRFGFTPDFLGHLAIGRRLKRERALACRSDRWKIRAELQADRPSWWRRNLLGGALGGDPPGSWAELTICPTGPPHAHAAHKHKHTHPEQFSLSPAAACPSRLIHTGFPNTQ